MTEQATGRRPGIARRARHEEAPGLVVGVEATRLAREVRGIGRYVRALLPRLLEERSTLRLVLFVRKLDDAAKVRALFPEKDQARIDVKPASTMSRSQVDVFWFPWNTTGPTPRRGCVVVTMHDVVPLAHPDPRLRGTYKNLRWRIKYRMTARRADLIITDSQFSADEIHRTLGVGHDRLRVVLLAADDFNPAPSVDDAATLERLGVHRPYVLVVGAGDQRKNLGLLDRAMPVVHEALPKLQLVFAGPRRKHAPANDSWRRTLGFVTDAELVTLLRGAHALVQPSTYEGFGLPVLEAMQVGTPVICAYASSLPEVGGEAAAWINPHNSDELARVIIDVASDPERRARMVQAGHAQSARFSWDKTARETLQAFDDARAAYHKGVRRG